jgi:hypothetical protein
MKNFALWATCFLLVSCGKNPLGTSSSIVDETYAPGLPKRDVASAASRLVFSVEPSSDNTAGATFAMQPVVAVQDAQGNTVTDSSASVSLGLYSDSGCTSVIPSAPDGSGALGGAVVKVASNGLASFDGISARRSGTVYLKAVSAGLTGACSGAMNVESGV